MAKVNFYMRMEDVAKLKQAIQIIPKNAEETINKYLHSTGKEKLVNSITNYLPVSPLTNNHAKNNKWYDTKNYNLSIEISSKRDYYYLYFPLTATGTSNKKTPNDFFTKGVENARNNIVDEMIEEINKNLIKEE